MDEKPEWTPDNLWVVAENQMIGRVACVSMDGYLQTYETQEEAEADAKSIIESLNEGILERGETIEEASLSYQNGLSTYASDSWSGELLADVSIGEDQNHIIMPLRKDLTFVMAIEAISIEAWKQKFPEQRFQD